VKWLIASVAVALGAVVLANALLLVYGGNRNDPVGRLSPIMNSSQVRPAPHVTETHHHTVEEDD
jgi:hypothetical protein